MLTVLISSSSQTGLARTTSESLFDSSSRQLFNKSTHGDDQTVDDDEVAFSTASSHTQRLLVPCGASPATSVMMKMNCGPNTQEDWKNTNLIVYVLDLADRACMDSLKKCHSQFIAQAFRTKMPVSGTKLFVFGVAPKGGKVAVRESDVVAWCLRKSDVWTASYVDSSTTVEHLADKVVTAAMAAAQALPVPSSPAPQPQHPDDARQKIKERRRHAFERAMFTAIEADRQSDCCEGVSSSGSLSDTPCTDPDVDVVEPAAADQALREVDAMFIIENSFAMHRRERKALALMEYDLDDDEPPATVAGPTPTRPEVPSAAIALTDPVAEPDPLGKGRMKSRSWNGQRMLPSDLGDLSKAHSVSLPVSPSHARPGSTGMPQSQSPPAAPESRASSSSSLAPFSMRMGFGLLTNRSKTSSPSSPTSSVGPPVGSRGGPADFHFPRWLAFPHGSASL